MGEPLKTETATEVKNNFGNEIDKTMKTPKITEADEERELVINFLRSSGLLKVIKDFHNLPY